jgi:hypothetical protein
MKTDDDEDADLPLSRIQPPTDDIPVLGKRRETPPRRRGRPKARAD